MHVCLFHIYNHAFTLFTLFIDYHQKPVMIHVRAMLFKQRLIFCHTYVIHSAISCFMFESSRMMFELLADSLL
jgi:hypothetical protein